MKILLVIDQFDKKNNGTTISTIRFAENLIKHGHDVKVITTGEPGENKYIVKERYVPIATHYAHKQGLLFAYPDEEVLTKAISECDIVHFLMPFALEKKGISIAKKLNKPYTSAFHVQAQNVTYNIGFGNNSVAVKFVYWLFNKYFYRKCDFIHCPSNFIANELRNYDYKGKLFVISNGVDNNFTCIPQEKPNELKDKYIITMVGRLSSEKRQDILINAIKKSKYKDKIQLIFAGRGPKATYYKMLSKSLKNSPKFSFFTPTELNKVFNYSDLYVHTADVEIEAIACLEAISCGLVPIISNSPQSATGQFAINDKCLFNHGSSDDLAKKIDYWLEHEVERRELSKKYVEFSSQFNIDKCITKIVAMFQEAIDANNASLALATNKKRVILSAEELTPMETFVGEGIFLGENELNAQEQSEQRI